MNSDQAEDQLKINLGWAIFTALLTIWTLISNFIVVLVFVVNRKLHNPSNLLVTHLAITDFLLAIMVLPISSVYDSLSYWPFSLLTCKYWLIADVVLCTASIWSLVCIAIDRYIATRYPFWYRKGISIAYKRFLPYFVIIWTISFVLSIPQMIVQKSSDSNMQCSLFDELHYVYYSAVASFVIPFVLMSMVYLRILCLIKSNSLKSYPSIRTNPDEDSNNERSTTENPAFKNSYNFAFMFLGGIRNLPSNSVRNKRDKKVDLTGKEFEIQTESVSESAAKPSKSDSNLEMNLSDYEHRRLTIYNQNISLVRNFNGTLEQRRETNTIQNIIQSYRFQTRENMATKRMATLVGLYMICWMPFTVFYLREELGDEDGQRSTFTKCIFWLGYANSGLNPFFYTILNGEFRYHLIKLLRLSSLKNKFFRSKTTQKKEVQSGSKEVSGVHQGSHNSTDE